MTYTAKFFKGNSNKIFLTRLEVLTIDNNPHILVKFAKNQNISNHSKYIATHLKEDAFVLIDIEQKEIMEIEPEHEPGHTCMYCQSQGDIKSISGFKIHSQQVNVISNSEDDPTEAKEDTFRLCKDCIDNIHNTYEAALEGEESDLLSHII